MRLWRRCPLGGRLGADPGCCSRVPWRVSAEWGDDASPQPLSPCLGLSVSGLDSRPRRGRWAAWMGWDEVRRLPIASFLSLCIFSRPMKRGRLSEARFASGSDPMVKKASR